MKIVILVIVAVLGLFFIFKRYNSTRKGEPASDELSRLILLRTSSLSFYVSLYYWLVISYLDDYLHLETQQLIGYGIIGMAIIFAVIWLIYKILGIRN